MIRKNGKMINSCDWLESFEERFGSNEEIMNIKRDKLHGSLQINFQDGVPINCNFNKHFRAVNIETNLNKKEAI